MDNSVIKFLQDAQLDHKVKFFDDLGVWVLNDMKLVKADEHLRDFSKKEKQHFEKALQKLEKTKEGVKTDEKATLCSGQKAGEEGEVFTVNGQSRTKHHEAEEDREAPASRGCCARLSASCARTCRPCSAKHNPLPPGASRGDKLKHAFLCPPHGLVAKMAVLVTSAVMLWACLWAVTGKEALPGGNFFSILVLLICCTIGGYVSQLCRLPPLFGMLVIGFCLRNIPYIDIAKHIQPAWASSLRSAALVVLLVRAGIGLDPVALKRLSCVVIRFAAIPCFVEAAAVAVPSHWLLNFGWDWCFMLAFVLAAVSPAVVVPSMLHVQEERLGLDKGIPTLAIAACSINAVIAISAFGVFLGIAFSTGELALTIVRGPLEALLGVVYGIVLGVLLWYVPHRHSKSIVFFRTFLVFGGSLFAYFGSKAAKLSGAGALGSLAIAFVAAQGWRRQGWSNDKNPVGAVMAKFWIIFQPLLFGLMGAEVKVEDLQGGNIGMGLAVLFIGLFLRLVVSFFTVFGTDLNMKEKIFMAISWFPKASVQAAIGPVAYDTAKAYNAGPEVLALGKQILTIAALSILITAPLGAAAIALTAPRFLKKIPKEEENIDKDNMDFEAQGDNESKYQEGESSKL
ncbi:sodium/hydrogen exchanger 9B2 [Lingula anatina]|uniref:Sodium/hydrogen exchanger 9B2 n=1 Tax=Lingula anatina TaxID=7574 RepID=A0A1S3IET7_LINAN|nr:sodium/hydrogen exchanger 9B2 [Lingula anatina]|eukprot:XP_013396747.1 sodium/hydrogen exchanger 9B2 [Lingula anatina]